MNIVFTRRNACDTFNIEPTQRRCHCGFMPHGGTELPLAKKGKKGKKGKR